MTRLMVLTFLWILTSAAPASAVPLLWNLDNVTFVGGGSASGSFIYDADSNSYSSVSVTTSGGGTSNADFDFAFGGNALEVGLLRSSDAPDFSGSPLLRLEFIAPLTDAGGIIGLVLNDFSSGAAGCVHPDCIGSTSVAAGHFESGSVVAAGVAPVPEPGTLALFAGPLLSLFWLRRRESGMQSNTAAQYRSNSYSSKD